ncbi:MAG TPA: GGDEF domain-containing protein [Rhizobium sp.]|nr:GGDEF domain-containing protein [Rhizobium sp.]
MTALSVAASVSIVLLLVPMLGGHPDGPGFWMSVLCPLVIAAPGSAWQFHQKETIERQRDEIARMHVELEDMHAELSALHEDLKQRSRIDSLTGGLNRESFFAALDAAASGPQSSALLIADADHFKKINDTFGHLVGDEALRVIGRTIAAALGSRDFWGRIGGEEFVLFLDGADRARALAVAEALRSAVAGSKVLVEGARVPLSVSIGARCSSGRFDPTELFRHADEDLYRAKKAGRNRIVIDGEEAGTIVA